MPRSCRADEVFRILRKHDKQFTIFNGGNGSHKMIAHPNINGVRRAFPVPYHKGHDLNKCYLKSIIKRFALPEDIFG